MLAPHSTNSRLYKIRSNELYAFWTGVTAEGMQVLLGVPYGEFVAVFFDRSGNLMRSMSWTGLNDSDDENAQHMKNIGGAKPGSEHYLTDLRNRLIAEAKPIHVRKFFVPLSQQTESGAPWNGDGVGVEDMPWHYHEYLKSPESVPEVERNDFEKQIQEWLDRGDFVLWWGNDYDMNCSGEVVSS